MKKQIILAAVVLISAGMLLTTGCKKEDATAPIVTLNGKATEQSILNATWTDAGATATDEEDGNLDVTVTGAVDKNLAGVYEITYSATDAAGNTGTATRKVTVYNEAAAAFEGTYSGAAETDINGPYTYTSYNSTSPNFGKKPFICTASTTVNNRVYMNRLGDFDNNKVYFDVKGTTLDIPSQTVPNVGSGTATCDVHDRKTDGTGSKTSTGFTLNYNDSKVAPCTGSRTNVQAAFVK